MAENPFKKDAGFRSRKWAAYIVTSGLIVIVGFTMDVQKVREIAFALVSALAIYLGGNVGQGWVDAKHGTQQSGGSQAARWTPPPSEKGSGAQAQEEAPEEEEEGS